MYTHISPSSLQLIYCLAHFKGDERIPPYIHRLIDPGEVTEVGEDAEGSQFTEDDYLALLSKNPETLFQDEAYMKHLRRHAHKSVTTHTSHTLFHTVYLLNVLLV